MNEEPNIADSVLETATGCVFLSVRTFGEWLEELELHAAFLAGDGRKWLAETVKAARYAAAVRRGVN